MSARWLSTAFALMGGLLLLLLAGCGGSSSSSSTTSTTTSPTTSGAHSSTPSGSTAPGAGSPPTIGFEGLALQSGPSLASAGTTRTATVDGIRCLLREQLAYHIHAHLAVYDHGAPRALPAGVGIPGSIAEQTPQGPVAGGGPCIYWLHTHTTDGVIHIESPTRRTYTLGEFFDEWHQPLSPTRVAGVSGNVTARVNGRPWTRDPRSIPLILHQVIQLDVGAPVVAAQTVPWSRTQL